MKIFLKIMATLMLLSAFAFIACDSGDRAGDSVVTITAIPGVVIPVIGATPVTTTINTDQYTGTIAWSPADNPFAASTEYTANIVLIAKSGFTLTGVTANFFTVAGATATNSVNSGVVKAVFAATGTISDKPVTFTGVTANGTSVSVTTTVLTLSFNVDPTSLTVSNIAVTGATKGALSGTRNNQNSCDF